MAIQEEKLDTKHRINDEIYYRIRVIAAVEEKRITDIMDQVVEKFIEQYNLNVGFIQIDKELLPQYLNSGKTHTQIHLLPKNMKNIRLLYHKSNITLRKLFELAMQEYIKDYKEKNEIKL